MKPKFKIGDKVKIKISNYILLCDWGKIFIIDKIQKLGEFKYSCHNSFTKYFREEDLELVQTSEQIAVEKALKEFKGKMQKEVEQEIRYLKGELRKTSNNWDKRGYAIRNCVYRTGYKLLKLLNEADDLMSGEEYLKKLELLK